MKRLLIIGCLCAAMVLAGCEGGEEADKEPPTPSTNSRGWHWVRNNPMFISALIVSMGPPPERFAKDYFNGFHATAVHLWADGLPTAMDAWQNAGIPGFRYVSWLQNSGNSAKNGKLIGGYAANANGRIGYQIGDEPAHGCGDLTCAMNNLKAMGAGINNVRAYDPNALLYVNFKKSLFVDNLIAHYGENLDGDIISYDNYNRGRNAYQLLEKFRHAGLRYNKPYWRYLRSYQDVNDPEGIRESDMRWDAFAGLVYGYTGHTWFIYNANNHPVLDPMLFKKEGDFNSPKTDLWRVAAQINLEMRHLGRAMTQLTSLDVCYIPVLAAAQPDKTHGWKPGTAGDPYITDIDHSNSSKALEILAGFFKDGADQRYLMVQNVSHAHGDFPVDRGGRETVRIAFDFSSAPGNYSKSSLLTLNKLTGQVEVLPLTHSDAGKGYVDIALNAGDPILLKYDNGRKFALR